VFGRKSEWEQQMINIENWSADGSTSDVNGVLAYWTSVYYWWPRPSEHGSRDSGNNDDDGDDDDDDDY